MKVLIEFNNVRMNQTELLDNARAWLSEYGITITKHLDNDKLYWTMDLDKNKDLQFLFMIEEDEQVNFGPPAETKEKIENHFEDMLVALEKITTMSKPLNEEDTSKFIKSISKSIEKLNKDNQKILNELNKIDENTFESILEDELNEDNDDEIWSVDDLNDDLEDIEEEKYRDEIIDRINSIKHKESSINIIEILLEYINDETIDTTVYNKLKSID